MAVADTTKKRSTLKRGSILDLPSDLDRKRFAYRWVNKARLDHASDGYEPRGYVPYKSVDGKHIGRGDLILCQKTQEDAQADTEMRKEAARRRTETVLTAEKEKDDRLAYEMKQLGGKMKFEYGEE